MAGDHAQNALSRPFVAKTPLSWNDEIGGVCNLSGQVDSFGTQRARHGRTHKMAAIGAWPVPKLTLTLTLTDGSVHPTAYFSSPGPLLLTRAFSGQVDNWIIPCTTVNA